MRRFIPLGVALSICAALFFSSCVTSGDLRTIEESIAAHQAGEITVETLREEVGAVADNVDERTEGFLEGISTGNGLLDLLLGVGVAVAGGVATKRAAEKSVHAKRDAAHAARQASGLGSPPWEVPQ